MTALPRDRTNVTVGDMPGAPSFGENLSRALDELEISGAELARRLGGRESDERNVRRWRNSRHAPQTKNLKAVADALEIPSSALLDGWEPGALSRRRSDRAS